MFRASPHTISVRSSALQSRPVARNVSSGSSGSPWSLKQPSNASSCRGVKERLQGSWINYPRRKIADRIRMYHPGNPVVIDAHSIARHVPAVIDDHEFARNSWGLLAGVWGGSCVMSTFVLGGLGIACGDTLMLESVVETTISFAIPSTLLWSSPTLYHTIRLKQLRDAQAMAEQELNMRA